MVQPFPKTHWDLTSRPKPFLSTQLVGMEAISRNQEASWGLQCRGRLTREANLMRQKSGDTGSLHYSDPFYNGPEGGTGWGILYPDDARYYEQNNDLFQRMSQNQERYTPGE
uniref:Uncharacterized protein n=1 Tax=Sphaerodactylus townsendi TaxID=933632 RepID=A0ACB8G7M2_9SAUR